MCGRWRAAAFDDTAWASGPGSFGFGNTPLGTTLNRAQKRTTYYFCAPGTDLRAVPVWRPSAGGGARLVP